jgi:hypothetical protein
MVVDILIRTIAKTTVWLTFVLLFEKIISTKYLQSAGKCNFVAMKNQSKRTQE